MTFAALTRTNTVRKEYRPPDTPHPGGGDKRADGAGERRAASGEERHNARADRDYWDNCDNSAVN
ncbi:hypothetical protein J6590_008458 [Homalodisca vitripennis]|nr:hypothetical protein J6590_008458 [Homalodisca vitripennis]